MKKTYIVALLFASTVGARQPILVGDVIATAKITGACGELIQLESFQLTTQLPGGDQFVARFLATEAARMGWTVDQLRANCQLAARSYMQFEKVLAEIKLK